MFRQPRSKLNRNHTNVSHVITPVEINLRPINQILRLLLMAPGVWRDDVVPRAILVLLTVSLGQLGSMIGFVGDDNSISSST